MVHLYTSGCAQKQNAPFRPLEVHQAHLCGHLSKFAFHQQGVYLQNQQTDRLTNQPANRSSKGHREQPTKGASDRGSKRASDQPTTNNRPTNRGKK